ncbi:hypothetical protein [Bacillus safensis]|uniref:hypothetical protein n=1 Tax=Bacillus safensis TaxID=561879 RepID=UPI0006A80A6C|nr:hypothetical protein [Bacillus safensis]MBR0638763.1 hypothetical protein [Bacillus safensis]CUB24275.1 hypothetical protein BN2127_JRS3_03779 [Bacillus safensis]
MGSENNSNTKKVLKLAADILVGTVPKFPVLTVDMIKYVDERAEKLSNSTNDIKELEELVMRKELANRVSEAEAKALQELAIANRIAQAEEVEIEEYYDTQGNGAAGVQYNESGLNLGASGSGRRISKRVYRFKGFRYMELDQDDQQTEENIEKQQTEE